MDLSLLLFFRIFVANLACFVVDLLKWVVVSSTVRLFVDFLVDSSYEKIQFNRVIKSNLVR